MNSDKFDIYIFRHGETDWNAQKRFQGHTDIPLNSKGQNQALSLVSKLKEIHPDVCISSDLARAIETAKIGLCEKEVSYVYTKNMRETFLGEAEGLTQFEIIDKYGENLLQAWRSIKSDDIQMSFPGGETKLNHLLRMKGFIREFISINKHFKKIAISSHGGSIVRLVHDCFNAPKQQVQIHNCCLYHLVYDLNNHSFEFVKEVI